MKALGASGYPMAAFNRSLIEGELTTAIAFKEAAFSQAIEMFGNMFDQTNNDLPAFVNLDVAAKVDRTANEQKRPIDSKC